ncbi:MAG: BtpA/SgcQ family protein [Chloroflexi bacterium]|nr:BtpA/SgcQ family protein [Chloroflexota bacterium]MDA1270466.1 BtpA/SgcQ family protein [Chloroflexota bacterium]
MSRDLFGTAKAFIGVVHLMPLPGSPRWGGDMPRVLARAEEEAGILEQGGVDGIIVENFGDVPFRTGRVDPETVAGMTVAVERAGGGQGSSGYQHAAERRPVRAGHRRRHRVQVHQGQRPLRRDGG